MSFVPECSQIAVAYADMQVGGSLLQLDQHPLLDPWMNFLSLQVLEYDLTKEAYTQWTKHCITHEETPILRKIRKLPKEKNIFAVVSSIFHMKHKTNNTYTSCFVSSDGIYVVEKVSLSLLLTRLSLRLLQLFLTFLFNS